MSIENAVERIHRLLTTRGDALRAEEAIKASLVMPFLAGLGHDPFDPDQVVAGYRTENAKVDFATVDDEGAPLLLINVTSAPADLTTPRARNLAAVLAETGVVGLLTNGREYRFHALRDDRSVVTEPFLSFDLTDAVIDADILAPLARDAFDIDEAIASGRLTKLPILAHEALLEHLSTGAEIRELLAAGIVRSGIATDASRAAVEEVLLRAVRVLTGEEPAVVAEPEPVQEDEDEDRRQLSGDEEAAFRAVCEIASRYVDGGRIHARPAQAYLAVLLDDNNRRTICRLYFSAHSTRYVGTFVGRNEKKHKIQGYADVPNFAANIEARLRELDPGAFDGRGPDIVAEPGRSAAQTESGQPQAGGPQSDGDAVRPEADGGQMPETSGGALADDAAQDAVVSSESDLSEVGPTGGADESRTEGDAAPSLDLDEPVGDDAR